ncbi:DUF6809 family protein [Anaerovorax odorimutans]|uniref:DUF6809 family protein n=1 Tax=Anaerovorax odorimutans TaxID=109327 RepID=UPI0004232938|nr:DUF6809 family protein [Anaerovorax odorimutans]
MKSILQDFYKDDLCLDELIVSKNPEYHTLNKKISDIMNLWKSKLSKDDFIELQSLLDLHSQIDLMYAEESFVYGFKLGTIMVIEEELARNVD